MSKFSLLQNNSNQYNRTSTSNVHEVSEEIAQLQGEVERLDLLTEAMWKLMKEKGLTIVPLSLYINEDGRAKIEIALARGKKLYDKRDDIAKKDAARRMQRERRR